MDVYFVIEIFLQYLMIIVDLLIIIFVYNDEYNS